MPRSVRFTTSIASADWSYQPGQLVRIGSSWTETEIPAANAAAFLESGVVEVVEDEELMETATPVAAETAARRPRRVKGIGAH